MQQIVENWDFIFPSLVSVKYESSMDNTEVMYFSLLLVLYPNIIKILEQPMRCINGLF